MQCGQEICFAQRACYYPCLQANKPAGQQLSLTLRPLAQHLLATPLFAGRRALLGSSWAAVGLWWVLGSNSGGITALTTGNFLCQCQRLCRQRLAVSKLFPFDRRPRINEAMRSSVVYEGNGDFGQVAPNSDLTKTGRLLFLSIAKGSRAPSLGKERRS